MNLHKKLSLSVSFSLILSIIILFTGCTNPATTRTKVTIKDKQWLINGEPVHKGSPAEGLLMNVRMVNAAFEDTGPQGKEYLEDFDPEENTTRFIAKMPEYAAHGVRGFTISLQGGLPGYEGAINSAFNADGSLREAYMDRVARIIEAADQEGIVVILTCFYQRQHSHERALDGKAAILKAVGNVAQWISDQEFTNVVLEISNEYAHGGFKNWQDGEWLRSVTGQVTLIRHAKATATAPKLLVSTSGMGDGLMAAPIAQAADFVLIHFNNTALTDIPERIEQAHAFGKPVLCNEDDKVGQMGAEAARLSVQSGAGWGLMHSEKNQSVPFEFEGAADDSIVYQMLSHLTTPGKSLDDLPTEPMSVLITAPKDGDVFPGGGSLTIQAVTTGLENFNDIEIHFFAGNDQIGISASEPWEFVWKNIPVGQYHLTAVVQDAQAQELTSSRIVDFEVMAEVP